MSGAQQDLKVVIRENYLKAAANARVYKRELQEILEISGTKLGKGAVAKIKKEVAAQKELNAAKKATVKTETEAQKKAKQRAEYIAKLISKDRSHVKTLAEKELRLKGLIKQYKSLDTTQVKNQRSAERLRKEIKMSEKEIHKMSDSMHGTNRRMGNFMDTASKGRVRLLKLSAALTGTMIAARFLKDAIVALAKPWMELEENVVRLAVTSNASAVETLMLKNQMEQLGETTKFTANEVAQMQIQLAKRGFTPTRILEASSAIVDLAIVTGEDLVKASQVAASTLQGFNLEASEMTRVVDVMTTSFVSSALDLDKFANSMKIVAPISEASGVSLESVTAALSKLADAGLAGTRAATGLKNLLKHLANDNSDLSKTIGMTVSSSEDFAEAMSRIQMRSVDLSEATGLVDERSKAAFLTLARNTEQMKEMNRIYRAAEGNATTLARKMEDTLIHKWQVFTSWLNRSMTALGQMFGPTVVSGIDLLYWTVIALEKAFIGVSIAVHSIWTVGKAAVYALWDTFIAFKDGLNDIFKIIGLSIRKAFTFDEEMSASLAKQISKINTNMKDPMKTGAATFAKTWKDGFEQIASWSERLMDPNNRTDEENAEAAKQDAKRKAEQDALEAAAARDAENNRNAAILKKSREEQQKEFMEMRTERLNRVIEFEMEQTNITDAESEARKHLARSTVESVTQGYRQLTSNLASLGRDAFKASKALAYADTVVSGVDAVQKARAAMPFPYNIPGILVETAAAATNLAVISKTRYGSKTSAPKRPTTTSSVQLNNPALKAQKSDIDRSTTLQTINSQKIAETNSEVVSAVNKVTSTIEKQTKTQTYERNR